MLPKTSTYVKSYDGQTKWLYFLIEDDDKVSVDIKKNLIVSLSITKHFGKSYGDEVRFYDKEVSVIDFHHTCLAESAWILLSEKMNIIIRKCL